ncbi:MAG: nitroreductase family protein [Candidatus Bilamarchaeaceae archaeon]
MDFYFVLKKRVSVRKYEQKTVEKEKIYNILAAASLAPSAGNLQSYKIYVVYNKKLKEDISAACYEQEFVRDAPVVFVFCADKERAYSKYEERGYELYAIQDATIAAAYVQLAAVVEGLGSVWVGAFDPLEISRLLSLPSHTVPVVVLPLGYPSETPQPHERRPINEIVEEVK